MFTFFHGTAINISFRRIYKINAHLKMFSLALLIALSLFVPTAAQNAGISPDAGTSRFHCEIRSNTEFTGPPIYIVQAGEIGACCTLCKKHSQCQAFTYRDDGNCLLLQSTDYRIDPATNVHSGLIYEDTYDTHQTPPTTNHQEFGRPQGRNVQPDTHLEAQCPFGSGLYFAGYNILGMTSWGVQSARECCRKCNHVPACKAWNYETITPHRCSLKYKAGPQRHAHGTIVSGRKVVAELSWKLLNPCKDINCGHCEKCVPQHIPCTQPPCSHYKCEVDEKCRTRTGRTHQRNPCERAQCGECDICKPRRHICFDPNNCPQYVCIQNRTCEEMRVCRRQGISCPRFQECRLNPTGQPHCVNMQFFDPRLPKQCQHPVAPGRCKAFFLSWHFNASSDRCEEFIYGGCEGNENRFGKKSNCQRTCEDPLRIGYLQCGHIPWQNGHCIRECQRTDHCPKGLMCCSNGCGGMQCSTPTVV